MPVSDACANLTKREWQVFDLVAQGLSSREIGAKLAIESRTVERHIDHIRLKTRTKNRSHMVAFAIGASRKGACRHDDTPSGEPGRSRVPDGTGGESPTPD